jgi:hypothetical protein
MAVREPTRKAQPKLYRTATKHAVYNVIIKDLYLVFAPKVKYSRAGRKHLNPIYHRHNIHYSLERSNTFKERW